jgi:hypothetical protein
MFDFLTINSLQKLNKIQVSIYWSVENLKTNHN